MMKKTSKGLTIGRLAKRTGCNIETIRYYERIKLLPEPARSLGGHRIYNEGHRKQLHFVCRSRRLGFTLDEVRSLLALVEGGDYTCAEVQTITLKHLQEVQQKLSDLRTLEAALTEMAAQCEGGATPECPVIDSLYGA